MRRSEPLSEKIRNGLARSEIYACARTLVCITQIRVHPGENAALALYDDNGGTYDCAKDGRITVLHRGNRTGHFTHRGDKAWLVVPDRTNIEVIHVVH